MERCIQRVDAQSNGYVYIKDLRRVQSHGYLVERITIIDDSPEKIARQPRNHIRVKPYYGLEGCLLYTSPSPRDRTRSRMPSSA